jgi:hypothetical protein
MTLDDWFRIYGRQDSKERAAKYDDLERVFMTDTNDTMTQEAPYPTILEDLVGQLKYRPGWRFYLTHIDRGQGSIGLTFTIQSLGYDTYHPENGETYRVNHYFIVPAASYNEQSWRNWLFERLQDVERHECAEFFQVGDERPYAPHHGPGNDPYVIFEHGEDIDRRTNFKGEIQE